MTAKIGRNDPCSCGSGEKYKHCCAEKQDATSSTVSYFGLGAILVAALAGGAVLVYGLAQQESSGRVWSSAHGHFHDVGEKPGPQPPGPAPAGKAWSSEHGHWHDAKPNEPAPEGKVWSPEHGHWHDAETGTANAGNVSSEPSGVSSEPPGPAPPGKVWSSEHGHWHDAP